MSGDKKDNNVRSLKGDLDVRIIRATDLSDTDMWVTYRNGNVTMSATVVPVSCNLATLILRGDIIGY